MDKNYIINQIKKLGFNRIGKENEQIFTFVCEGTVMAYLPDEDDEKYLHLAAPMVYEVNEENRTFILEKNERSQQNYENCQDIRNRRVCMDNL